MLLFLRQFKLRWLQLALGAALV
ncbi:MAG: hypothetical protein RIQ99_2031, partial [Pseudomonadota bacterium]